MESSNRRIKPTAVTLGRTHGRESSELVAKMSGDRTAFAVSPAKAIKRKVRKPPRPSRRLRVYALDPSVGKSLDSIAVNETTLSVHWDDKPSTIEP
jgi:hypothetical protein